MARSYSIIAMQPTYVTYDVEAETPEEAYAAWKGDQSGKYIAFDRWDDGEDFVRMEWTEGDEAMEIADEADLAAKEKGQ